MTKQIGELAVTGLLATTAAFFVVSSGGLLPSAGLAPAAVSAVVLAIALVHIAILVRRLLVGGEASSDVHPRTQDSIEARDLIVENIELTDLEHLSVQDVGPDAIEMRSAGPILMTLVGFVISIGLFGFAAGSGLMTLIFLALIARERLLVSVLIAGGVYVVLIIVFDILLGIPFPDGMLADVLSAANRFA